jgi:peptidoglycan LD-endopeptidase LytH
MRKARRGSAATLAALLAFFCAGVLVDWYLREHGPPRPAIEPAAPIDSTPSEQRANPRAATRISRSAARPVATSGDIPRGNRRVPIDSADVESWKGGFAERRDGRPHEAVDILAPRNTPVHAVEDGTIAKLFVSKAGGLTIYHFDPSGQLCYYYAHLERYADGLREGQHVNKGDVIGYVGTSGNAPPNTPHLHFAVFQLDGERRWWKGTPIDPYEVFRRSSTTTER